MLFAAPPYGLAISANQATDVRRSAGILPPDTAPRRERASVLLLAMEVLPARAQRYPR